MVLRSNVNQTIEMRFDGLLLGVGSNRLFVVGIRCKSYGIQKQLLDANNFGTIVIRILGSHMLIS